MPQSTDFSEEVSSSTTVALDSDCDAASPLEFVKALERAHLLQRLLEGGECASITEPAAAEKIDRSYLCRVLRLTLLAPDLVESIMDGRQSDRVTLPALMKGVPEEWRKQQASVGP